MSTYMRPFFGLGALTPRSATQTTTTETKTAMPTTTSSTTPAVGMCSPDGQYIWAIGSDGNGYWKRKTISETCKGTVTYDPNAGVINPTVYMCSPDGVEYVSGPATNNQWQATGRIGCVPTNNASTTPPPSVNTIETAYSATNIPTDSHGGVTVTPLSSLRTWTGMRDVLVKKLNIESIRRLVAIAPSLPPCPSSSITDDKRNGVDNQACYAASPVVGFDALAAPPGTFAFFEVPFHVSEILENGRFERNDFIPTEDQRLFITVAMLERSYHTYRDYDGSGMSVKAASQNRPNDFRTFVDGFPLNPVQPTDEEMTTGGGYDKWRARGGYPLSLEVIRGAVSVTAYGDTRGVDIRTCASISCACPQNNAAYESWRSIGYLPADQEVNVWPRCIGARIGKDGMVSAGEAIEGTWNIFVAMSEADPTKYSMHVVFTGDAWYKKTAQLLADQLQKLAGLFCAAAPSVKDQLAVKMSEVCIDKQQKPCTKGTPNCICSKPPASASISVNAFNAYASHWCSEWMAENAAAPVYEEPVPQVPPELLQPPSTPWWKFGLVAAAGIGAGAFFFNRRNA